MRPLFVNFVAVISLCLTSSVALAMEFEISGDGPQKLILANGEIRIGDDEKLHRFVAGLSSNINLLGMILNSSGGNYVEGVRLATSVQNSRIKTGVPPDGICASACFLIFASGTEKFLFERARIGVHSASYMGLDNLTAQAATTLMARKAAELGVPPAIIGKMVTTPPSEISWLSEEDLQQLGVESRQASKAAYQPGSALVPGASPPVTKPSYPYIAPPLPASDGRQAANAGTAFVPGAAFMQGRADRLSYDRWFDAQVDDIKRGAAWWAENRSQAARNHLTCAMQETTPSFIQGCIHGQFLLTPTDLRRTSEPDYRAGWNSV